MTLCYCLTLPLAANSLKLLLSVKAMSALAPTRRNHHALLQGCSFPASQVRLESRQTFAAEALESRLASATVQAITQAGPSLYASSAVSFVNTNIQGSVLRSPEGSVRFHLFTGKAIWSGYS